MSARPITLLLVCAALIAAADGWSWWVPALIAFGAVLTATRRTD